MRRTTSRARGIGIAGLVALMIGGALLGTAVAASASGSSGSTGCVNTACALTLSASTDLATATPLTVTGADFNAGSVGAAVECNMAQLTSLGEPTIVIPDNKPVGVKDFGSLPVGCGVIRTTVKVTKAGTVQTFLTVATGQVGPPVVGTDTGTGSTGSSTADAVNYPCPPTQAQVAAGVSCAVVFQDAVGSGKTLTHEMAYQDISFTTAFSTLPTTPTTIPPPAGCAPKPSTVTSGNASITLDPATCLQGGTTVTVTGSGLNPKDLGSILECNTTTGEPTAWNTLASEAIPVGCTDPKVSLVETSATGTVIPTSGSGPVTFGILIGTIGPPFSGANSTEGTPPAGTPAADLPTDSNAQATIDTAKFPCPPAGSTTGTGCALIFGDQAPTGGKADQVIVPITFNEASLGTNPTKSSTGTTTPKAKKASTAASSSSLAFTGAGPGLWWLGALGALLMLLGGLVLAIVEGPRRFLRFALDHRDRTRGEST